MSSVAIIGDIDTVSGFRLGGVKKAEVVNTAEDNVTLGAGEEVDNDTAPHIYNHGLVTIGEKSVIPNGVTIGKNSVVAGVTSDADYDNLTLPSGKTLIKAGE